MRVISSERAKEIAVLYYDDVYHLCLSRLKRGTEASDVTQEVFLFFQEKYSDLDDASIKSWLFTVANNKIKEQFRHIVKREKELVLEEDEEPQIDIETLYNTSESEKIDDEELEEKKKKVISSLNEKEYELFEMVHVKHLGYEELARVFNVSEHTMRTRVYRLRLKIKEKASHMFMALLLLL